MNYKVGDKVVVREWNAMSRGKDAANKGDIFRKDGRVFVDSARKLFCNNIFTIKNVYDHECTYDVVENTWAWNDNFLRPHFEYGEEIEVRDREHLSWLTCIYVGYIDGAAYPYHAVSKFYETEFKEGKTFGHQAYKQARKLKKVSEDQVQERYDMCQNQDAQIDCRDINCIYNKNGGGHCQNVSPAITINANGTFACWSKDELCPTCKAKRSE